MGKLTGTKTLNNLMNCVAGEAQARSRYNTYAKYAAKTGYQQVANVFNETAANEFEHFKVFYKLIAETEEQVGAALIVDVANPAFPVGLDKTGILDNLQNAAAGEREEWQDVYSGFAKTAKEEGLTEAANKFTLIGGIEKQHQARFEQLAMNYTDGTMFEKPEKVSWICLNCGYVCESKTAPKKCPACGKPQGWFEMHVENY